MFRPRRNGPVGRVAVIVEGRSFEVPAGASAAAAVLVAGLACFRESAATGAQSAPYCMIGVCFNCLAEIDGVPNRQSCMVEVSSGMRIRRQQRARPIDLV